MGECDPDHALLLRISQGDTHAFRVLIEKHLSRGVKVAERMLGNRQDAEDVMQEVCLKIWKESPRWQPRAKFSTWLYRVVLNACLDRKRRVRILAASNDLEEIADEQPIAEQQLMNRQMSKQVKAALHALSQRQRAAIILSYYEGLGSQEAAECMRIRLGAFQQLLHRAKQNLKASLGEAK